MFSATGASAQLFAFLKKAEEDNQAQLTAYNDGFGTWTIGYGSVYNWDENRPVSEGDTIDQATADRWLQIEATQDLSEVRKLVTVPISQNALVALSSFAYNEGLSAFQESTLLKLLNSGTDVNVVADQFDRWVYAGGVKVPGLVNRRNAEKQLFLS